MLINAATTQALLPPQRSQTADQFKPALIINHLHVSADQGAVPGVEASGKDNLERVVDYFEAAERHTVIQDIRIFDRLE